METTKAKVFHVIASERWASLFHETVAKTNAELGIEGLQKLFHFPATYEIGDISVTVDVFADGSNPQDHPYSRITIYKGGEEVVVDRYVKIGIANSFGYFVGEKGQLIIVQTSFATKPLVLDYAQRLLSEQDYRLATNGEDFVLRSSNAATDRHAVDGQRYETLGEVLDEALDGPMDVFAFDFLQDYVVMDMLENIFSENVAKKGGRLMYRDGHTVKKSYATALAA